MNKSNQVKVIFTKEHIDYLNSVFPENVTVLSNEDMYYRTGQRSVIKKIEFDMEQARKRSQEVL